MVEKQEEAKHVVEFGQLLRFSNSFFSRIGEKEALAAETVFKAAEHLDRWRCHRTLEVFSVDRVTRLESFCLLRHRLETYFYLQQRLELFYF